jgi:class 3 adenylate cyclase/tetratricopeptide (TPR) repeat protein
MSEATGDRRPGSPIGRPTGSTTFLFTDIVGSTRLWEADPEAMRQSLAVHDAILRRVITANRGYVFATGGDAFAAAFHSASDAVRAAIAGQTELQSTKWPSGLALEVRMGLHAGEADERDGDYFGPTLNRASRIMSMSSGGRIVASSIVAELAADHVADSDVTVAELGLHDLKDVTTPIRLVDLRGPSFDQAFADRPAIDLRPDGERRQVTVLYLELRTGRALDPEDQAEQLGRARKAAADTISHAGGHVAAVVGDTMLAYFGYPVAYEDNARRALRAAWAITAEGGDTDPPVRVAVHTGLAVVEADSNEGVTILGHALPVTMALHRHRDEARVVLSGDARRVAGLDPETGLVAAGVDVDRGLRVDIYELIAPVGTGVRPESRGGEFVGRASEVALITDQLRGTADGEGSFISLVGDAGIGKSRLVAHVRGVLSDAPLLWLSAGATPESADIPFSMLAALLRDCYRWSMSTPVDERVRQLAETLGDEAGVAAKALANLADLAPHDRRSEDVDGTALTAWASAWITSIATRRPTVVVVEDLHWVDAASLDVIHRWTADTSHLPLALLFTARPTFVPPWQVGVGHTLLRLAPLTRDEITALISARLGDASLDDQGDRSGLVERLAARSDGMPLFAEELASTMVDLGSSAADDIPATLHDALTARLDRVGEAKAVAQIGAVLGREFSAEVVAEVGTVPVAAVERHLSRLSADELVQRRTGVDGTHYVFRHALVQQAAYDSLLRRRRRELHARVAAVLSDASTHGRTDPAVLARHWEASEAFDQAAREWELAALSASRAAASRDACRLFASAIDALRRTNAHRVADELRLQEGLIQAVRLAYGWNSPELDAATETLREMAERCEDRALAERTLLDLWSPLMTGGDVQRALSLAEDLYELATTRDDPVFLARSLMCLSISLMNTGRAHDAIDAARRAIAVVNADGTPALSPFEQLYVRQSAGNCVAMASVDLAADLPEWIDPINAVIAADHDPIDVMMAHLALCTIWTFAGDIVAAGRAGETLLPMAQAAGLAPFVAFGQLAAGRARFSSGDVTGLEIHRAGMDALRAQGMMLGQTDFHAQRGRMLIDSGDLAGARAAIDAGFALSNLLCEPHYLANLWRARAALAVAEHADPDEIARCFDEARELTDRFGLLHLAAAIERERDTLHA